MILRDSCSTSYDLTSLFRSFSWQAQYFRDMRPSALHSTFHYWRKSRRIASFLLLPTSKIEDVSQTCFVFHIANFKNWGSLAGLLPFWRYQVQKLRKSRRIASFSSLQIADKQIGRLIDNYNDNYHYTTLHYITLHCTTLHYTTTTNANKLRYIALH